MADEDTVDFEMVEREVPSEESDEDAEAAPVSEAGDESGDEPTTGDE